MSNRVKVENKSSKKGSYKEQREDYKKEFARILEELTKVFQSFAAIKNSSVSGDLRIPSEELNELRNKVSLLCDEINTSMSINSLSPESYKQLAKNQSRAVNQLERIDLTINVLKHVEALLHNAVMTTLREAARQKAEVRQKDLEADKSQQDDLEQIQQRFEENNALGNGIAPTEAIGFCQAFEAACQEVQKAHEEMVRTQGVSLLKAYQSAARHFLLLKEYLKESKGPAKELVELAEKYSALAAEVEEESVRVLVAPKATLGGLSKPNFQKELKKYTQGLEDFYKREKELNKQVEKFEREARNARVKFDKQAGFSLEALREGGGALPPDAKVAGGYSSSRAPSRSVGDLLQENQKKYSKHRQEFAKRLSPKSDTAWVRYAVGLSASNHSLGTSLESMTGSPSFSRSEVGASANSVSPSPSHSRQASQDDKARSPLDLHLDRAAFSAWKTPITLEASSQRTPAPSSLLSPTGAQGGEGFVPPRPPSTSPPQSPEENQPGAMAAVREDVLLAAPPLPVVGRQSPRSDVQNVTPSLSLLSQAQENNPDIPAAPQLPLPTAVENKQTNPVRTSSVENKQADADQAAPSPRGVTKQVNSSAAAGGDGGIAEMKAKLKARQEQKEQLAQNVSGNSTSSSSSSTNVSATTQLAGEGAHEAKSSPQKAPAPSVRFSGNSTSSSSFSTNVSAATQRVSPKESFLNNEDLRQHGAAALANRRQGVEEPHSPSDDAWDGEPPARTY